MTYDASIRSEQEFNRDNNELIERRNNAQTAFDEAMSSKHSMEDQIQVLEELKYTITDEVILGLIQDKIVEFEGEIATAEITIEESQVAFNEVAEENIIVQQKRVEELAEIDKLNKFNDARGHYEQIKSSITDYQNRLKSFNEDAEAAAD